MEATVGGNLLYNMVDTWKGDISSQKSKISEMEKSSISMKEN